MNTKLITLRYYGRCLRELIKYGRRGEYVRRYGYRKTLRDIWNVEIRSHWLQG